MSMRCRLSKSDGEPFQSSGPKTLNFLRINRIVWAAPHKIAFLALPRPSFEGRAAREFVIFQIADNRLDGFSPSQSPL
jgi:hypothetical protein